MADVQRAPVTSTLPQSIPQHGVGYQPPTSASISLPTSGSLSKSRNPHLNPDTFSPVNQNGSFEFDRVLRSGYVEKRTRRTKAWKRIYLVLRPNCLSIYKDQNEDKLRHKIRLTELTAVAFLKDPKQKRQNVFGLFSPARNWHLEAASKEDAEQWVELIRREARIEEEEEEMFLASPGGNATGTYIGFERAMQIQHEERRIFDDRLGTSSPEPGEPFPRASRSKIGHLYNSRRPSHTFEYSGNELASHSDMSDVEHGHPTGSSAISIPVSRNSIVNENENPHPSMLGGNHSQVSGFNAEQDPERVIWQGYLLHLKSSKGVRQWKSVWAVLRPRNIAFYKDDSEYSPRLILPLASIINAVEIDPISRTKRHCMQVITEEKSYRFCAPNEDVLDKSLGAFKSLLARRKDSEARRSLGMR